MNKFLFGNAKNSAMVIARIAIMLALTVLVQYLTGLAKIQLLTGSFVNLFLLLSAMLTGIIGGIIVGIITPFIALLVGLNPNVVLVPFIALGNALYVVVFAFICLLFRTYSAKGWKYLLTIIVAVAVGAAVKFLFMYLVCVKAIFPLFLPEKQVVALSTAWGVLQLFTALIGGGVAVALSYPLKKLRMLPIEQPTQE